MVSVAWLLLLGVLLAGGLYGLSFALRAARRPATSMPFESGGLPSQHAVSRYHVRWYTVTILFLAFDMEMVFMYPWAVVVAETGAKAVVEMFAFLLVLVVGVVYVWREGGLRWV